jgi:hypothetical protein
MSDEARRIAALLDVCRTAADLLEELWLVRFGEPDAEEPTKEEIGRELTRLRDAIRAEAERATAAGSVYKLRTDLRTGASDGA